MAVSQDPSRQTDGNRINPELSDLNFAETVAKVGASGDMIGFSILTIQEPDNYASSYRQSLDGCIILTGQGRSEH